MQNIKLSHPFPWRDVRGLEVTGNKGYRERDEDQPEDSKCYTANLKIEHFCSAVGNSPCTDPYILSFKWISALLTYQDNETAVLKDTKLGNFVWKY